MCPTTFFALARATAEAAFVTVNSCWDRLKKNTILTTIPLCIASIKKMCKRAELEMLSGTTHFPT